VAVVMPAKISETLPSPPISQNNIDTASARLAPSASHIKVDIPVSRTIDLRPRYTSLSETPGPILERQQDKKYPTSALLFPGFPPFEAINILPELQVKTAKTNLSATGRLVRHHRSQIIIPSPLSSAMSMQTAGDVPLLVTSENSSSERRITPSWTIGQLKAKLEPVTGIPPLSQRLVLKLGSQQSVPIEASDEENTQLGTFPLAPYAEIHVSSAVFSFHIDLNELGDVLVFLGGTIGDSVF